MTFILAFFAGVLSTLSPCVLPLLPMVIAGALNTSRKALIALAAGLTLSFTLLGLFIATIGFSLGINQESFRTGAAVLLLVFGVFLLFPKLFEPIAEKLSTFSNFIDSKSANRSREGVLGQFLTGLLLGAIWTPCVGPTLGVASILAAKGENLFQVFITMLVFGLGASAPLVLLGLYSQSRGFLKSLNSTLLKKIFGALLLVSSLFILTGFDKAIETFLVKISPDWLNQLTTKF